MMKGFDLIAGEKCLFEKRCHPEMRVRVTPGELYSQLSDLGFLRLYRIHISERPFRRQKTEENEQYGSRNEDRFGRASPELKASYVHNRSFRNCGSLEIDRFYFQMGPF